LYGFVHRAFLEFFCASSIVYRFEKTRDLPMAELKQIFERHRKEKAWHEVLRLICGAIGESFAGELIQQLTASKDLKLAVECLSEVRKIENVAEAAGELLVAVLDALASTSEQFQIDLVYAAELIGTRWPHREKVMDWLRRPPPRIDSTTLVGYLVGTIGNDSQELRKVLLGACTQTGGVIGGIAIMALSYGWKGDSEVANALLSIATSNHPSSTIAIKALARSFKDESIVTALFRLANENEDARHAVMFHFAKDERAIPLLMATAGTGGHPSRGPAIVQLQFHTDVPKVRRMLTKLATDEEWGEAAAYILAKHRDKKRPPTSPA
jgi:hypothetical protein